MTPPHTIPAGPPPAPQIPGGSSAIAVGSGGALTPTAGSPYKAGVKPSGITGDPVNRFVYVTDFASNELIGYSIQSGGALNFLVNGPFKTGNEPNGDRVDPRGIYIYVSNALDSSVTGYNISLPTGTPSARRQQQRQPGRTPPIRSRSPSPSIRRWAASSTLRTILAIRSQASA